MSDITGEVLLSGLIIRRHFVRENDARIMTFESLTLTPFGLEKTSARRMVFKVLAVFHVTFGLNHVESARITITHVCFIILTL